MVAPCDKKLPAYRKNRWPREESNNEEPFGERITEDYKEFLITEKLKNKQSLRNVIEHYHWET